MSPWTVQVGPLVLVVLGRVDVDMDDGAVLGELVEVAGDAVVEAHAEGESRRSAPSFRRTSGFVGGLALLVLAVDGPVGEGGAVHAEPAQGERMCSSGKPPMPMSVVVTGMLRRLRRTCFSSAAAPLGDDAAAGVEHRAFRLLDQVDDLVEREIVRPDVRGCSRAVWLS
jgi:hypothetical protein